MPLREKNFELRNKKAPSDEGAGCPKGILGERKVFENFLRKIVKNPLTNQDFMILCHGAPKTAGGFAAISPAEDGTITRFFCVIVCLSFSLEREIFFLGA